MKGGELMEKKKYAEALNKLNEIRSFSERYLEQVAEGRRVMKKRTTVFDTAIKRLKGIRRSNQVIAYPNNLDAVVEDIKKVEAKYNLRPRQLESIVHYHQMESELLRMERR